MVFTVPEALHPFFLSERRKSYALLFEAALGALHAVCERRLGATPGTIAVLHTWSQTLAFHPHVHCIVTGGGLDMARDRWISARPGFLVPVRVLSRVFRGKLLEGFSETLRDRISGSRRLARASSSCGKPLPRNGSSTARHPWPVPPRCCATSGDTPIASPSATNVSWLSKTASDLSLS